MEVASTVQPNEGEPRVANEFSLLNVQFAVFCFPRRNLCQEWVAVIPSHHVRRRFPSVCALDFRCCKEISSVSQTFDERIRCIERHDDFSPRSHCKLLLSSEIAKTEAIVEPVKSNRKRVSLQSPDSSYLKQVSPVDTAIRFSDLSMRQRYPPCE